MKHIYVVLPKSETTIAKISRKITKYPYSHVTLCMQDKLEIFYSFSRLRNDAALISGFAKEYRSHLASKQGVKLTCKIFKIPVTNQEYSKIEEFIQKTKEDDTLLFNYLSMATLPVLKGFDVYKTQNCCSFVAQALEKISTLHLEKPSYKYFPRDFDIWLSEKYFYFEGDLNTDFQYEDDYYFEKVKWKDKVFKGAYSIKETFYRLFFKKVSKKYDVKKRVL